MEFVFWSRWTCLTASWDCQCPKCTRVAIKWTCDEINPIGNWKVSTACREKSFLYRFFSPSSEWVLSDTSSHVGGGVWRCCLASQLGVQVAKDQMWTQQQKPTNCKVCLESTNSFQRRSDLKVARRRTKGRRQWCWGFFSPEWKCW